MTNLNLIFLICLLKILTIGTLFSKDNEPDKLFVTSGLHNNLQPYHVSGKVTDAATGEPLLGVTVVVKGTTIGQITDQMGNFAITIPEKEATLIFSFVGYVSQEILVEDGSVINVSLNVDVVKMEEVVIVGYGIQKKESLVASISQTTGEDILTNLKGSDLRNALSGSLTGLITLQGTGIPGGSGVDNPKTQIFIRGVNTWNNAQPLILVDGIEREMDDVDPYTIEKISILKDASATAVFGVKGANGVLLITTKRGQIGKPRLTLNVNTTAKSVSRLISPLGSYDALKLRNYAILNEVPLSNTAWNYITPEEVLNFYRDQTYPDYLPDVNWQKEFLKDFTFDKTVNLSVSGGTQNIKYFGALSYLNEGDILKLQDYGRGYSTNFEYNRFNFRSNFDLNITPTTIFSANLSGFYSDQKRPRKSLIDGAWFTLYRFPPDIYPMKYSDGTWGDWTVDERFTNQILSANFYGYQLAKTTQVNSDFQLNQKLDFLTKGLSAKIKLSYDIKANTNGRNIIDTGILAKYISPDIMNEISADMTEEEIKLLEEKYTTWIYPEGWSGTGYDFVESPYTWGAENAQPNVYRSLNYEFSLNYDQDFGKHNIAGLLLMSRNERATGSVFPSYREDWVGRAVYNYDSRYLLEFNAAYNGSEKFAKKYRFGFFPSMAIGWIISNEQFFANITPVINNLKLRFSDGKVGSDAGIDRWLYTGSYNVTNDGLIFGAPFSSKSIYPLRFEDIIPNPDIQWETSHKQDIGIETGFFQNLIRVNFDYFWEDRTNIFVSGDQRIIPVYFGAPPVAGNIGQVKNHGWEIESEFSKTTSKGLKFFVALSWAFAKDIIIKRSDPELAPDYQKDAGYPIGQRRSLLNENIIQTWNDVYTGVLTQSNTYILPGDFRMIDFNSDGIISDDDAAPFGYPRRAQYSYSPKIGIDYKGFGLNLNFYGTYNTEGQNLTTEQYQAFQFNKDIVYPFTMNDAWSPELGILSNAKYSGLKFSSPKYGGPVFISRAAFRLKSAVIHYNLNSKFTKKIGISNLRFLINGENLFLWSDMLEDGDFDIGSKVYPMLKRITFGVNLNL